MTHAAKQNPDDHGHMTLLAHIDANNIPSGEVHGLASRILVPGGHLFKLSNDGQFKAGRECWRRGRAPPPANMNDVSDVSDWRLGLERVTLGESAGRTSAPPTRSRISLADSTRFSAFRGRCSLQGAARQAAGASALLAVICHSA